MGNIVKVSLLATSDIHGFYLPWDYAKDEEVETGGLARISTIINNIREENPHTVVIDNGDLIQGNSAEYFLSDKKYPGIEAINLIKYDIYNMGNHEFNFGMDHLNQAIKDFNGVSMMGNIYKKGEDSRYLKAIYYKEIAGVKIAFISLNTPLVRVFEAKRGNLDDYTVTDAEKELELILSQLEDVDAVIGLFHMGKKNENDIPFTGVKDLIENVDGSYKINGIFAGHMHKKLKEKINDTYILEPGAYGQALSRIDLYFDLDKTQNKLIDIKAELIDINKDIDQDSEVIKVMQPYHNKLRAYINEILGYSDIALDDKDKISGIPQTRISQSKLGDFFTDLMLYYSNADIVAYHFDNFFPNIKSTTIRRKDLFNAYRYVGGEISKFVISGKELKAYMEWSAGYFNSYQDGDVTLSFDKDRAMSKYSTFDMFGNLYYEIDLKEEVGNRIKNICKSNGKPINDDDQIVIGMNKYRMDFLCSSRGPLAGKDIRPIWSSMADESIAKPGNIRSLAISFLDKQENKTYKHKRRAKWNINAADENTELVDEAIALINNGDLLLYKDEDGNNDLTRSINLYKDLENYQLDKLKEKYDIGSAKILIDVLDIIRESKR